MYCNEQHFHVPVGNAFELRLRVSLTDGTIVPASSLTDIHVRVGSSYADKEYAFYTDAEYINIPIPADLKLGAYDVHASGLLANREVAVHYKGLIEIVAYGTAAEVEHVTTDAVIIGQSDDAIRELKQALAVALDQAQEAKAAAEEAKSAFTDKALSLADGYKGLKEDYDEIRDLIDGQVAKEETSQQILEKVDNINIDLSPITDKIGTPAEGQPETLFEAIANGGSTEYKVIEDAPIPVVLQPNTLYIWGEISRLEFTLGEPEEGRRNEYMMMFVAGDDFQIVAPESIEWEYGVPQYVKGEKAEISILNNIAVNA